MEERIRIATYNVHGWVDQDFESNLDRVVEVVTENNPDILCLQEVYACWELPCLLEFMRKTTFTKIIRWGECAILSKSSISMTEVGVDGDLEEEGGCYHFPLPPAPGYKYKRPRYTTVRVEMSSKINKNRFIPTFYLTCIHLSPKYSDLRYQEIKQIRSDLTPLFTNRESQVWLGDFNTLTESDYSSQEWDHIVKQRVDNGRQHPCNKVPEEMNKMMFTDSWEEAGCPLPRETSKFKTRVDYIYSSSEFISTWKLADLHHHISDASDHNLVQAEFILNQ